MRCPLDAPGSRRRAAPWPQPRHLPCLRAARDPLSPDLPRFGPQGSRWGVLGAIRDLWGPRASFKGRFGLGPTPSFKGGGRVGRWWPRGALARAAIGPFPTVVLSDSVVRQALVTVSKGVWQVPEPTKKNRYKYQVSHVIESV